MYLKWIKINLLCVILVLFACCQISAQSTLIYGRITEAVSGNPVSFANVAFKGTAIGTSSDQLGNFTLETTETYNLLTFSAVGYIDTTIIIKVHERQEVKVYLTTRDYMLSEIVINAGENPAFAILRKVVANKELNNPEKYDAYEYRSYNKVQFDLNNFSDKIKKNPLFRPFPFIWQYQDTMANGVRYLPFLFKENVRDHYFRKQPQSYKEYVVGSQNKQFFRGPKIEEFIEELYLNPDIYENFISILTKNFPSPINDNFNKFYKYYLNDTLKYFDGVACHHIRFYPKNPNDVAFSGEMYIHDSTFAVKRIDLNFSIEANINFVRSFYIRMDYDWLNKQNWFIKEITVLADFTVVENASELTGFFGRRFSEYKNVVLNQLRPDSIYAPIDQVIPLDSSEFRTEKFWRHERSDTLSLEEQNVANLVDTIQDNWKFKLFKGAFTTVGTGWIPLKKFDIGNIFTFTSYNDIEGVRLKAGFRTAPSSTFPIQPRGYIAYGTRDEKWKYMGELNIIDFGEPGKHNLIGAYIQSDADQLGRSYWAIPLDHFLTYILQVAPFDTRTFVENKWAYLERQWFLGFVTRLSVFTQNVRPFGDYNFYSNSNDGTTAPISDFTLSGFRFSGRFAYGEKEVHPQFYDSESKFFMLKYPAVSFEYSYGEKDLLKSQFDYQRLNLRVEHQQRIGRWGYLAYIVEGGKVWGEVPYPFLAIPFGNQSIIADKASFNGMNYLEFASDEYASIHLEHHFEGFFLNKIPFNRILKLREFVFAKIFAGRLSDKNNEQQWAFPDRLFAIEEPYVEVGFGIENILKISRIDFTWRLNYLHHPEVYRFLPKPSFQFRF